MTKEPVYYCERCEKVLERKEQGVYTWCETCRRIWSDGFTAGIKAYKEMLAIEDFDGYARLFDELAPYKVRE